MKKLITILIGIFGFIGLILFFTGCQNNLGAVIPEQTIKQKYLANEKIKERYNFDNGKLVTKIKDIDDIKITVGENNLLGAEGTAFKPDVEISRWNGEVKMKVKPRLSFETKTKDLKFENKKIKYKEDKKEYQLYEVKKGDETYNGATSTMDAYETEIDLLEKPTTNVIEMDIETQGLKYYYQLPLNEEMKGQDCWTESCTEIDCCNSHRPENVVGSYAVYHESKTGDYHLMGGKNYRAGKAFHIYRPRIIDNAGKEVWGKLNIDVEKKLLTVEIPQEFLDTCQYPVICDPTFGYDTAGGSSYDFDGNSYRKGNEYSPESDGTLDSIHGYVRSNSYYDMDWKGFVNEKDSEGTNSHGQIATGEQTGIGDTSQWTDVNLNDEQVLSSKVYVINETAYVESGGGNAHLYYDSVDPWIPFYSESQTYSSPENPWNVAPENQPYKYSIYATYTAGGGGTRRIITTQ